MTQYSKDDDTQLFIQQMQGVTPLKKYKKIIINKQENFIPLSRSSSESILEYPTASTTTNTRIIKPALKPKKFKEGCSFTINFDDLEPITSQSILTFNFENLSTALQTAILKGNFHSNARIDLHGQERYQAQEQLQRFITHAKCHQNRYLLVIHGKGSKHGETPILKQHIYLWLRSQTCILALHSAHAKHGGTGALYVVLKKHSSFSHQKVK